MWELIERLQQKPESVRLRYVLLIAAVLTGLIVLLWLAAHAFLEREDSRSQPTTSAFEGAEGDWERFKEGLAQQRRTLGSLIEVLRNIQPSSEAQ